MTLARFEADQSITQEWQIGLENQTVYGYLLEEERLLAELEANVGTPEMRDTNRKLWDLQQTYPGLHNEAQKVRFIIDKTRSSGGIAA